MYFAKGTEPTEYCMDHVDDKEEFEKRLKKKNKLVEKISSLVKIADGHPSAILFTNNAAQFFTRFVPNRFIMFFQERTKYF